MIMASLVKTTEREEVIRFTQSFWEEDTVVVFKRGGNNWMYFSKPFHWQVWAVLLGFAMFVSLALCIFNQGIYFKLYLKKSSWIEKSEWIFITLEHLTSKCKIC